MNRPERVRALVLAAMLAVCVCACVAWAQDDALADRPPGEEKSLLDFVAAGGIVGYAIIVLSAAGAALVIDACVNVRADKLLPSAMIQESQHLASLGKFSELLSLTQASDSLAARVIRSGLEHGQMGVDGVREAMRERGTHEVTRLQQRVAYMGFIAAVAPMLGLLGTVVGMIGSFDVLGRAKGAARPDELAVGISKALVTTCMGLIVAVPLMFFHNYFRDRITRVSQDLGGLCERLLRIMTMIVELRAARAAQAPAGGATPASGSAPAAMGPAGAAPSAGPSEEEIQRTIDSALAMDDKDA